MRELHMYVCGRKTPGSLRIFEAGISATASECHVPRDGGGRSAREIHLCPFLPSPRACAHRSFFGPLAFLLDFIAGKEFGIRVRVHPARFLWRTDGRTLQWDIARRLSCQGGRVRFVSPLRIPGRIARAASASISVALSVLV